MSAKVVIMVALCAMLLAAPIVHAQNFTPAQIQALSKTVIAACNKSLKDKTCDSMLTTAGKYCSNAKNVKTCTNLMTNICKSNVATCRKLGPAFCNKTGAQKANCLKLGQGILAKLG